MAWYNSGNWEGLDVGEHAPYILVDIFEAIEERLLLVGLTQIQIDAIIPASYLSLSTFQNALNNTIFTAVYTALEIIQGYLTVNYTSIISPGDAPQGNEWWRNSPATRAACFVDQSTYEPFTSFNDLLTSIGSTATTDTDWLLQGYYDFNGTLPPYRGSLQNSGTLVNISIFILLKEILNALTHVKFIFNPDGSADVYEGNITSSMPWSSSTILSAYDYSFSDTPANETVQSCGFSVTVSSESVGVYSGHISRRTDTAYTIDLSTSTLWDVLYTATFIEGEVEFYSYSIGGVTSLSVPFYLEVNGSDVATYTLTDGSSHSTIRHTEPLVAMPSSVGVRANWAYPGTFSYTHSISSFASYSVFYMAARLILTVDTTSLLVRI